MKREKQQSQKKGNKKYLWIIISFVIILIAVFTNPKKDDFTDKIYSEIYKDYPIDTDSEYVGFEMLGLSLADKMLGNMLSIDNYLVFSRAKVSFLGESKTVAYGFFGQVILNKNAKDAFDNKGFDNYKSDEEYYREALDEILEGLEEALEDTKD